MEEHFGYLSLGEHKYKVLLCNVLFVNLEVNECSSPMLTWQGSRVRTHGPDSIIHQAA